MNPQAASSKIVGRNALLLTALAASLVSQSATAANITMTATNVGGTTGYNTGTGWPGNVAPAPGNNYFTGAFVLRTPAPTASGNNYIFAGDSLSIDPGARFLGKIGNNVSGNTTSATITVPNLILNGGWMDQADTSTDNATLIVAGNVTVSAASTIGAIGGAANGSPNFNTLEFTAPIGGSGGLTVGGTQNGGGNTGVVKLSAANPYTGTITVATPGNGFVASSVNRLLQLNHLDALANGTLNLTSVANGISFTSAANTGAFHIGALSGNSNQALTDTASAPVTLDIGGNGASTTYSGVFSGSGSLIKSGAGTLTLSGANFFSNPTNVNGGTLAFATSFQTLGAVNVANGAGLGVKASAADTTLLSVTDLSLGSGGASTLALDFNSFDTAAPLVSATGTLAINGSLTVTAANAALLSSGLHPLVSYSSFTGTSPTGSFALSPRSTGTLVNNPAGGVLNLNVASDKPKWTGSDNGNWVVGSTGASKNWKLVTGSTATDYIEGDNVRFDDSAPGTRSVQINTANVSPAGVTFDTLDGYSLSGAFGIAGSAPLTKSGSGTLTITNANSYTGATTITEGTLQLGDGTTDGSITNSSSIANDGTLVYNRAGNFNYNGVISGIGSLVKSGPGTQTLTAANIYLGATTVNAGKLSNGIVNALPIATDLTISGGTYDIAGFDQTIANLSDGGSNTGTLTNSGAIKNFTVTGSGDTTFAAEISGPINLLKTGSGTLTLPDGNSHSGMTRLAGGTVVIGSEAAFGTSLIDFNGGGIQSSDSTTRTITNPINFNGPNTNTTFGGTAKLVFTATPPANATDKIFTVNNPETEFAGVLGGASGRIKEGNGLLIFSGLNNYTGATTINAGTLRITNPVLADTAALVIGEHGVLNLPHGAIDQVGSLTINGVAKANGVYDAVTDPGFITGSGKIRVGAAAGYSSWTASFPFTAGVNDGPEQDADGDGINNVLEYVLGGIPVGPGSIDLSILPTETLTASDLVLTFKRSDLSESDTTLKVQWSAGLNGWNDFATIGASDALPAVDITEDSPTADLDTVVVTIPRSNAGGGKLFVRLLATKP